MKPIKIELTLKEFQSLKVVLQYIMDNEVEHYQDCLDEDYNVFVNDHVYAHAKKVMEALDRRTNAEKHEYLRQLYEEIAKQPDYYIEDRVGSIVYETKDFQAYLSPGWLLREGNGRDEFPENDNIKIDTQWWKSVEEEILGDLDYVLTYNLSTDLAVYLKTTQKFLKSMDLWEAA